jgi:phosphohistidine phosphatase
MRHALAQDPTDQISDAERKLTDRGVANTLQAAKVIKALGLQPDHFYTSPLLRARQTAEIVGKALAVNPEIHDDLGLGFGIPIVELLTRDLDDDDEVLFVGHEPSLSTTIASLTGGRVQMKRGGLARVDLVSKKPLLGTLVWLIAPKVFDSLD